MKQMISNLSVILQGNVLTETDFQFPPTVLLAKYSFLPITSFFPDESIAIAQDWLQAIPQGVISELFTGFLDGILATGNPVARFEEIISSTGHVLAYSYLGLYYYKTNAYQNAAEVYSRAIEKYPEEAYFYASRCLIYRLMGEEEGAFYDYQIAKRLDFNYHSVLEWQENQGDITYFEAENLVIQELEPKQQQLSVDELNSLGLEYVHCYDYVKAIELYSMAIERNESPDSNLLIFRGSLYLKLTCFELALRDFNQAIALDAQQTAAYIFRAKVFESYRYTQKALADYAKAEELDAQSSIVFEERASLFERLGSLHEALSDFDRLVELNPTDFYVYSLRADLKEKLADMQGALLDYSRAIELNPYYSDLYAYRAAIKEKLGDSEGAKQDLEKFEELEDE
ncbi:tetratricopeptide repeat protein [Sphingobacterium sp. InxBP1]|uniref:tetratricopeptide repeat protein n=1 Tax=Sphingobacterium sp. InxBP1 TaxID=2870328 RepID=UPI002244640B|nr:tetratricopeptide repeat protein [Sphingobacterium sp. InxBP1]MCW8314077.1 tetratricopeptide repeat protein [Sphingobacterium sp. InxBP1]